MIVASSSTILATHITRSSAFKTIISQAAQTLVSNPSPTPSHDGAHLSKAKRIGIALGVLVPIILGLGLAIAMYVRKNNREWNEGLQPVFHFNPPIERIPPEKTIDGHAGATKPAFDRNSIENMQEFAAIDGETRRNSEESSGDIEPSQRRDRSSDASIIVPKDNPPNYFLFEER